MTRRRAVLRIALVGAGVLAAIELALHVLDIRPPSPAGYPEGLYVAAPGGGWRLAPNFTGEMAGEPPVSIRTNPDGFRDAPFEAKTPGVFRIVALGDSFGFGHGVEARAAYPDLLEGLLSTPERPVEVLNLGVPGYNTKMELAQLRRLGARLDPDLVLLGCYLGNDPSGNLERRSPPPRPRFGVLVAAGIDEPEWRVTLRAFTLKHSFVARNLVAWRRKRELSAVKESNGGVIGALCESSGWDAGQSFDLFLAEPTDDAREALDLTERALREIAAEASKLDAEFAVALLPAPLQYAPAFLALRFEACGIDPTDYDVDRPNRLLSDAGARDGYPVLDLTPIFRARQAADPAGPLFGDVHFNGAGHALAAQEMAMFLLELGLVE